jgi:hypothetical protein
MKYSTRFALSVAFIWTLCLAHGVGVSPGPLKFPRSILWALQEIATWPRVGVLTAFCTLYALLLAWLTGNSSNRRPPEPPSRKSLSRERLSFCFIEQLGAGQRCKSVLNLHDFFPWATRDAKVAVGGSLTVNRTT